ncbi:hypothetical protein [Mesorhizobium sp. M0847]|uniref:hypothetical protein n=1 Tax=unclassified Mesorhizobium TaxID=325217 RepID=UPI00333A7270
MIQLLEIFCDVMRIATFQWHGDSGIMPRALQKGRRAPVAGRRRVTGIRFAARDPDADKEASA